MGRWIQGRAQAGDNAVAAIQARLAVIEAGLARFADAQPNYVNRGTQRLLLMHYCRHPLAHWQYGRVQPRLRREPGVEV